LSQNPTFSYLARFVGTIAGKAVADGCLLGVHFTRLFYKRVLGRPVTYHDMASHDVQFYKSLCWVSTDRTHRRSVSWDMATV
jgi:hypothetical protein